MLQCQRLCSVRRGDCAPVNHDCVRVRTFARLSIAIALSSAGLHNCFCDCTGIKGFANLSITLVPLPPELHGSYLDCTIGERVCGNGDYDCTSVLHLHPYRWRLFAGYCACSSTNCITSSAGIWPGREFCFAGSTAANMLCVRQDWIFVGWQDR